MVMINALPQTEQVWLNVAAGWLWKSCIQYLIGWS